MKYVVGITLLVALVLAVTPACLAKTPSNVGVVDWEQVLAGFTAYQEALKQHQDFTAQRQAVLTAKFQVRMLDEAQGKECDDLRKLAAPTEEQKKRLDELLALSDTVEQELATLKANTSRTPEQEKRMQDLQTLADTNNKALEALQAQLKKEVTDKFTEIMNPLDQKLKKTISEVADQQKLGVVLNKGDVLYGGEDITDKVLAKVNKS